MKRPRAMTMMDSRGRITLGKKLAKRYGRSFFVVPVLDEIILVPKVKDPVAKLQEWSKKTGHIPLESISKLAEEEAYKEIGKKFARIRRSKR